MDRCMYWMDGWMDGCTILLVLLPVTGGNTCRSRKDKLNKYLPIKCFVVVYCFRFNFSSKYLPNHTIKYSFEKEKKLFFSYFFYCGKFVYLLCFSCCHCCCCYLLFIVHYIAILILFGLKILFSFFFMHFSSLCFHSFKC